MGYGWVNLRERAFEMTETLAEKKGWNCELETDEYKCVDDKGNIVTKEKPSGFLLTKITKKKFLGLIPYSVPTVVTVMKRDYLSFNDDNLKFAQEVVDCLGIKNTCTGDNGHNNLL